MTNETLRMSAWMHLIAGAEEKEIGQVMALLSEKYDYLQTIKPMLRGEWSKN